MSTDIYRAKPWTSLYPAAEAAPGRLSPSDNMLEIFQRAVRERGEQVAINYFDSAITYWEVDSESDRFANWLISRGIGKGDRVAIMLQNVPQFTLAVLGAWKVGAVPTPVNPMYKRRELELQFADCTPKVILCLTERAADVRAALAAIRLQAAILTTSGCAFQDRNDMRVLPTLAGADEDEFVGALRSSRDIKPAPVSIQPGELGLLLYTSGTTGTPKGAMLTHANLVFNSESAVKCLRLHPATRMLGLAPLFHVTGFMMHLCAILCCQGSVILGYRFQPQVVLDAVAEHRPTIAVAAISAYVALLAALEASPRSLTSLEEVYSGGAPVPPAIVEDFERKFGLYIHNGYGMSELTCQSHITPPYARGPIDDKSGVLSIGIPIPGIEACVVDDAGSPLPVREHGEILVRGPNVMAGYWNRPGETAEVIQDGWMHTGDVGFMDADGWFYVVDRKKDMICASGFKVWPQEVEGVLYSHPAVREAAAVGGPDSYRGETVVAFVSLKAGVTVSAAELRAFCSERLAAYKVPREYEVMTDLPKTASGKIMRAELRRSLWNS